MKLRYLHAVLIAMVALLGSPARTQERVESLSPGESWIFAPSDDSGEGPKTFLRFGSSKQAMLIVDEIMAVVGLPPRFDVYRGPVENAAARIENGRRVIYYSQDWVANKIQGDRWQAVTLLAHEIGHHLSAHTLDGLEDKKLQEIESDIFAGYIVARLGGSLKDAQRLYMNLPKMETKTHPSVKERLEAVAIGWTDGREESDSEVSPSTEIQSATIKPETLLEESSNILFQDDDLMIEQVGVSLSKEGNSVSLVTKFHNLKEKPLKLLSTKNFSGQHINWATTEYGERFQDLYITPLENLRANIQEAEQYISIQKSTPLQVLWKANSPYGKRLYGSKLYVDVKFYRHIDSGPEIFSVSFGPTKFREIEFDNESLLKGQGAIENELIRVVPLWIGKSEDRKYVTLSAEIHNLSSERLHLGVRSGLAYEWPHATTEKGESFNFSPAVRSGFRVIKGNTEHNRDYYTWLEPGQPLAVVWSGLARGPIEGRFFTLRDKIFRYEDGRAIPFDIQLTDIPIP